MQRTLLVGVWESRMNQKVNLANSRVLYLVVPCRCWMPMCDLFVVVVLIQMRTIITEVKVEQKGVQCNSMFFSFGF